MVASACGSTELCLLRVVIDVYNYLAIAIFSGMEWSN